jgi:hypothetical protein
MPQEFTCPRRNYRADGLPDHWSELRWVSGFSKFPARHLKPRTCSYCGAGHPEDLIELVRAGWEVESTNKHYKRYIRPPGFRLFQERWTGWMLSDKSIPFDYLGYVETNPSVKMYTQHFTKQQVEEYNAILEETYHNLDTAESMF